MPMNSRDLDNNSVDSGKFCNLKAFVVAAREFESTHSEASISLMNKYLGLIASTNEQTIFSPGRTEVCAFFSTMWRVMCDVRAPHWSCIAVLSQAVTVPNTKHVLTHTYKFMPILSRLLSNDLSSEKKVKLLFLMKELTYGIKITWQESYLSSLLKQLTHLILKPMSDSQLRIVGHISLTVLVNICYNNLPAIHTLMRTVDTKSFVVHLINLKDGGYEGVEVCRLLVCLSGASRGISAPRQTDVHSYLCCSMRTFKKAVVEQDATQLLHAYTFIKDLCDDSNYRSMVLTFPNFNAAIRDSIKNIEGLCLSMGDGEFIQDCLKNVFKLLTVIISLDMYTLRSEHVSLLTLCMLGSQLCLSEALELFAAIVTQYRDEGGLTQELISTISDDLSSLLVPSLQIDQAGLQWLQVIGALSDSAETQDRVLKEVTTEKFEDVLFSLLDYMSENGSVGLEQGQIAVISACRSCLTLAPHSDRWGAALARVLAHHQVKKLLCLGLTSNNGVRRRQILQLVKHHYFPTEQMNQVFGESMPSLSDSNTECSLNNSTSMSDFNWQLTMLPAQEEAIDAIIAKLNNCLDNNLDICTTNVMELYGYKMTSLEQRLHSQTAALESATQQLCSLKHSIAMLQATNTWQQDLLYSTQMMNEKNKKTTDDLHKQLEDAEVAVRGFRDKLAAERLDKEKQAAVLQKEMKAQLANIENEVRAREKEAEERMRKAEAECKSLHAKLEQQTMKNNDLAGVLVKFEERVKNRDKRLEEATNTENALRKEIEHKNITVKQLEKTVLERENRLYQVSSQLNEMKRVQEMVTKLMSKTATS